MPLLCLIYLNIALLVDCHQVYRIPEAALCSFEWRICLEDRHRRDIVIKNIKRAYSAIVEAQNQRKCDKINTIWASQQSSDRPDALLLYSFQWGLKPRRAGNRTVLYMWLYRKVSSGIINDLTVVAMVCCNGKWCNYTGLKHYVTLTPQTRGTSHPSGNTSTMNTWSARVDLLVGAERVNCSGTQPPIHTQLWSCMVWFNFTI